MRVLLLLVVTLAGVTSGSAIANDISTNRFKVVVEDGSVYLFDSDADAANFNTEHCYNAFVDPKGLKQIRRTLKKGKSPSLSVTVLEKYFDRRIWGDGVYGHYIYKGTPLPGLCERDALVVINSVKEGQ